MLGIFGTVSRQVIRATYAGWDIWFVWSTDKREKCLAPRTGIEPWTSGFHLCVAKLQFQCATIQPERHWMI